MLKPQNFDDSPASKEHAAIQTESGECFPSITAAISTHSPKCDPCWFALDSFGRSLISKSDGQNGLMVEEFTAEEFR
ncbi:MAG: hypothetical protein DMG81_09425 [Acidobacteria bacterium]|nr:MAG: hypothetical protein DMG81_09425 [Acidobacteriota bacterium]